MFLLDGRSDVIVANIVNTLNPRLPIPLTEQDFYFGKGKDILLSTRLPSVTMYTSPYKGSVVFTVERIDLSTAFGTTIPTVVGVAKPTLHDLLPDLNKLLGVNFHMSDIVNYTLTWLGDGEEINLRIKAKDNSPGYRGDFIIKYIQRRVKLYEAITILDLEQLKQPDELTGDALSMSHLTWGLDFSAYSKWLTVTDGVWDKPSEVVAIMAELGVVGWNNVNSVIVQDTANVPTANKTYRTVILQKCNTAGYEGYAYFHMR